jgi:hypothetical protein
MTKIDLNYIYRFSSYLTVNTQRLVDAEQGSIPYMEIIIRKRNTTLWTRLRTTEG